jgi:hypothetical protein
VGRTAGLHDDQGDIPIGKPALELGAAQALGFNDTPVFIGYSELEHGLCKIDGNGSSIHVGLLMFEDLIPTPMKTSAPIWRKKQGESIPSIDTDPQQQEEAPPLMLVVRSFLR